MRKLKVILLSLVGSVLSFAVVLLFILSGYTHQDYQQLLITSVDHFSDYTLAIAGPFELQHSYSPLLSVSGVELHSKTDNSYVYIDHFKIQITLAPLLKGTLLINDLVLENMRLGISPNNQSKRSASSTRFLPTPVIEHAVLKNLQLMLDADQRVYKLDTLIIAANNRDSPLEVKGSGIAAGHKFTITAQSGPLKTIFTQKKYPLDLLVRWQQARLTLKGTIADPAHGEGLDLVGEINVPEIADFFAAPPYYKGHLQGKSRITGDFDKLRLSEIQTVLSNKPFTHLNLTGAIGNVLTQAQTGLHLSGYTLDTKLLKQLIPGSHTPFNRLDIEMNIDKDNQAVALNDILINLANEDGLNIKLTGHTQLVQASQPFRLLALQAEIDAKETAAVRPYLGDFLPEFGALKGTAQITSQGNAFVLSRIDILAGIDKKVQLRAKGRVGPLATEKKNTANIIAVDLTLNAERSSELTALLAIQHPEIGPVAMTAHLAGSLSKLTLETIQLKAGEAKVLSLQFKGRAEWDKLETDTPQQTIDLAVQLHSPSIQDTARLYGENIADLGAFKYSMRLHGKGQVLAGSDLTVQIGSSDSMLLKVNGSIEKIFYTDFLFKGIELNGSVQADSTSHLSKLLGGKIPDIGPLTGQFILKGDANSIQIPQLKLVAGRKNHLLLTASGKLAAVPLNSSTSAQGVDIDLTVTAPGSVDVTKTVGIAMPDFGRLSMSAHLTDKEGEFAIDHFNVQAERPGNTGINLSGSVASEFTHNEKQINILFDEKTLLNLLDIRATHAPENLTASLMISNAGGDFGAKGFTLKSGNSEILGVKITKAYDKQAKVDQLSINTHIFIPQPELFGRLFSIDLSGVRAITSMGVLHINNNRVSYKGNSFLGKTKIYSDIVLSLQNKKTKISGEINSPDLFLSDFGIMAGLFVEEKTSAPEQKIEEKIVFSHAPIPIQVLHTLDLDLQLRIHRLNGEDFKIDKANILLLLQDGKLIANPVNFIFSKGQVEMQVEVNGLATPEVSLHIKGEKIQLGDAIKQQYITPPVEGEFNFNVNLSGRGDSAHKLVSSLDGDAIFTLENGGIRRSQLELVFLNPLGWLFRHGISENEIQISCGLARYQVNQGIIRSKVFLIDGPKLLIRGNAEMNLSKETINSLYNLEKKDVFNNPLIPSIATTSVPVKVSGKLSDPDIELASLSSVKSITNRFIFAPVVTIPKELVGTAFDIFTSEKKVTSPCRPYLEP